MYKKIKIKGSNHLLLFIHTDKKKKKERGLRLFHIPQNLYGSFLEAYKREITQIEIEVQISSFCANENSV